MRVARVSAVLLLFTLATFLSVHTLQAQVVPQFSTIEPHEYDSINLATMGIRLNVPVRTKAGHIPFTYNLTGAAQVSFVLNVPGQPQRYFSALPWLSGQESGFGQTVSWSISAACVSHNELSKFAFTDAAGSSHTFSILIFDNSSCGPTNGSGYAADNSGLFMYIDSTVSGYVLDVDGNKTVLSLGVVTGISDPNGNSINRTPVQKPWTYTDTLGQTALVHSVSTSAPQETDAWTDAQGNSQSVKLYNTPLSIWTAFGCGSSSEDNPSSTPNFPFTTSVSFPDNTTLTLGWEKNYANSSDYTGRLASLTLPTSGTISYAYSGGTNGVNCSDGTPATVKRTTPDGVWTYTHAAPSSYGGGPAVTTVSDPQGNNIVYTFTDDFNNLLTEKQVYNGAVTPANLVQTTFVCYNNTSSTPSYPCSGTLGSPGGAPTKITQKDVYTTFAGVTGYSAVKTSFDTFGRITDVKTFDFNASTATNEKVIAYGNGNPSTQQCSAISTYIIGKPCSVTLLDSQHSNAVSSQAWNAYDSNGNLTQTWSLVSGSGSSGTYLSKQFIYSNGVVQTATDVNGQVINYSTTSCNNMFTTSQYPTGFSNLQTSQTWDCNGGVLTSATVANGQTTHTQFTLNSTSDPFYRPMESVDQLGNVTSFVYTSTTLESIFLLNSGASVIDALSTTDSIGRPAVSQLKQAPGSSTWDTKSRTFDGNGRTYQTTLPCATTSGTGCSTSAETQTYDGLNRPLVHTIAGGEVVTKTYAANDVHTTLTPAPTGENAKATQKEFDALGRLKSVCVISSATGSGPCGQTNGGTGFLTKYSYDAASRLLSSVENAQATSPQQTRSYTYDLLGRVLTETNPESGTSSNTYDSVTGTNCASTSAGDLVQKVDANGNTTCYFYDGLHRNTKITYAGPNSNGVSKYFVYDSATVNGAAMTFAEGHMAEAYTCSGSCTSKITDEGFSYDQRGNLADYFQSSPNSGGYYHLSSTRWENNAIKTVSGVGLPTLTYGGLDGEGRVTTVTASSGTNPVSAVTYNYGTYSNEPIGALLAITLGTGDSQNFTYDPNTGRMTSYSASVGATPQAISGTLTWNQNGTLLQNNISDAYNSGDTQNCKYLYDDFIRAASVNCLNGSTNVWNQTFTYGTDSFGNITKNGSGTFLPTYSSTTNQITLLPGNVVPTYDADGNITKDAYHAYTWLADGHVATIDTNSITYDAMGNKIEENVAGTIHEYVSAFGVSAQMTAQTQNATTVALPGGLQALYSGGTFQRFRFPDWQGTIRAESSTARVFTESLAFAPFGERYATKGAPYNVDSFTGKPDQIVADEYDFAARELHNGQGRWISPDPMPGSGNKYAYVDNNPLSNIDLFGLTTMSVEINGFEVGTIDSEQVVETSISESYVKTAEAAALIKFTCGALDCSTPGTDRMLQSLASTPDPGTQTPQSQQQTQAAQNTSQTKQLTADDVSKGIKAFDSDKDDKNPGRVVKALDTMGKDFTVSGDTLKQGVKDSGVALPKAADKVLANVDSITRTGDKVVITNKGSMTIDLLGQVGKTVSFTINESAKGKSGYQGPELQNLKGVGIGFGPFASHPDHWGPE